jgi:hypothetical protein
MGYYSDVLIAHAVLGDANMTEVFAAYSILPSVQRHNLLAEWKFDRTHEGVTIAWYHQGSVKWDDGYPGVRGILALGDLLVDFGEGRGFAYATVMARIGDETSDIEYEVDEQSNDDDCLLDILYEAVKISRSIDTQLTSGD